VRDHDAAVFLLAASIFAVQGEEVLAVVCEDRALLFLCLGEQVRVGQTSQLRGLIDRESIVATSSNLLGDLSREHLPLGTM
jgi:hypothetical protein